MYVCACVCVLYMYEASKLCTYNNNNNNNNNIIMIFKNIPHRRFVIELLRQPSCKKLNLKNIYK